MSRLTLLIVLLFVCSTPFIAEAKPVKLPPFSYEACCGREDCKTTPVTSGQHAQVKVESTYGMSGKYVGGRKYLLVKAFVGNNMVAAVCRTTTCNRKKAPADDSTVCVNLDRCYAVEIIPPTTPPRK